MTWSSPMTAVSGSVLTASQFNRYVRDNLNESMVAKATQRGQYFVCSGTNAIAARSSKSAYIYYGESNPDTTTDHSGNYVDLNGTRGPSVSATTGTSAIVMIACMMDITVANVFCGAAYDITGATTIPADASRGIGIDGFSASTGAMGNGVRWGAMFHESDTLNPGTNVFTMRYINSTNGSATAEFDRREILVMPL